MNTECSAERINFHGLGGRGVVGRFDGGRISSDGGCVLLREVEERTHILNRLAGCFVDHRDPELIEHSVGSLVKQRVYGIALGYEDLNDHDTLRYDALLGLLADKEDPSGAGRRRTEDRGKALAGKSTSGADAEGSGEGGPLQEDSRPDGGDGYVVGGGLRRVPCGPPEGDRD